MKAAPQSPDDDAAHASWMQRAVDAFEKSVSIAEQHGGLVPDQLALARDAVTHWNRIKSSPPKTRTEQERKQIYFEVWETFAEEMLRQLEREQPSSAKAFQACADRAVALSKKIIVSKYGLLETQMEAICVEGKAKNWPQPKMQ